MNPLLLVDSYKIHHTNMYPKGMTKLYSNLTPRKSRMPGVDGVVVFGIQHFILTVLIDMFNKEFFEKNKEDIINEYKRHCPVDTTHIEELWDLQYLPLEIKALQEGTICPIRVPCMTITNTHDRFGWLVNYLETLLSCMLWQPITSATISYQYKKLLDKYAFKTTGSTEAVQWQGHDFSMRGMSSPDSAILSGMGHLISFTGTDTIPAIYQLEKSYFADGLIGASVPATEHSVMCMGTKEDEIKTFERLLDLYPTGILSVVSDTWNLWDVIRPGGYCYKLYKKIISRDGKLVIRPDSGNPVDIICGMHEKDYYQINGKYWHLKDVTELESNPIQYVINPDAVPIDPMAIKGVIEALYDTFGGTQTREGYTVLDPHIGAIYGDSINLERAEAICERLMRKGFASTNIVFGIGSFTYQYNTRDTFGFAMKATYGEITHKDTVMTNEGNTTDYIEPREIFKAPITDDGEKKSAKGLLKVDYSENGKIYCKEQCTWEEEKTGLLKTVFFNGKLFNKTTLEKIRIKLIKEKW